MIKKIILTAGSIVLVLLVVLGVHIYQVTGKGMSDGPNWSMGKIEVSPDLDSTRVEAVQEEYLQRPYIRAFRINREQGHFILLYDRKQVSGDELAGELGEKLQVSASLYRPSAEELASSCPAIPKDSFTYQLGSLFQSIFTKL
ncbi:heavy-metal-associated domain-containing protein [Algoriphagus confluentis]|uniref:Heavy-metal-associated domain-containing protein n=1 Tax=Algoriphagus confluentis TaxID=1697556 RepID=A0ABQ6PIS3_9BACT|nr:hypothetical protein Aconfl_04810 [Algoriphagus confluentis]